jgi:hypothetical protein
MKHEDDCALSFVDVVDGRSTVALQEVVLEWEQFLVYLEFH